MLDKAYVLCYNIYIVRKVEDIMVRREIEAMLVKKGIKQIDIYRKKEDELAIYCTVSNGHIKDYTGHVLCGLKDELYGYIDWKEDGGADKVGFDNPEERKQIMKNGYRVDCQ